MKKFQAE